ncbi:MAG: endonuclease/exonuclease/phosphatase family protein [Salibacteraceae bacterium]
MSGNRLVRLLLLLVNGLVIICLLMSLIAPYIAPHTIIFPAFFGLIFIPITLLNLSFIVFWLILRPAYSWFSIIALILSIPNLFNHLNISSDGQPGELKVMSYNVRLFDLYNWTGSDDTRPLFVSFIQYNPADIYCFQEYFNSENSQKFTTQERVAAAIGDHERHEYFTAVLHNKVHQFGIATYSKYPIIKKGLVPLDTAKHNVAIYTDIDLGEDTVRVFNMHLASVHLSAMANEIDQHIQQNDQLKQWRDLKQLIKRLAGGYKKRSQQADHIADYISESPYPVIVCGDFNDTPGSYSYQAIRGELEDAFVDQGLGFGTSYVGFFPSLRIDYILNDPVMECTNFTTHNVNMSDHRPITAHFILAN